MLYNSDASLDLHKVLVRYAAEAQVRGFNIHRAPQALEEPLGNHIEVNREELFRVDEYAFLDARKPLSMHLVERAFDFVLTLEKIVFLRRPVKVHINKSADLPTAGEAELLARLVSAMLS